MPPSINTNLHNIAVAQQQLLEGYGQIIAQNTQHELQMLHVQQRADRMHEMVATRSNLQKSHYEAMMNVISNMK